MIKEIYEKRLPNGMMELRQSLVGWYYGYPNEADTKTFMGMFEAVCEYELEE